MSLGTVGEAGWCARGVLAGLKRCMGVAVWLWPPSPALTSVGEIVQGTAIGLGAQNCHYEASGPHTGEIAPPMLVELGCRSGLIGHPGRRRGWGGADEVANPKGPGGLAPGVRPLPCIGETAP